MKLVRYTIYILILLQFVITTYAQDGLRDLLSDRSCSSSCWLGIEVEKTSEGKLQEILALQGLSFTSEKLGLEGSLTYYAITGYSHPFVDTDIAIYTATGGNVSSIQLALKNVDVNSVVEAYGYPDRIAEQQARFLIYSDEGIVFGVPQNSDEIFDVNIQGSEYTKELYIEQSIVGALSYKDIGTCTDDSQLCAVVNSMQNSLRDLLSNENCSSSCWLGIESRITTEDELIDILNSHGIEYEKQTMGMGGDGFSYEVVGGYTHPLVVPNFDSTIVIIVNESIVRGMWIHFDEVQVNDVIMALGSPSAIFDTVAQSVEMVYMEHGLVFTILEDNPDFVVEVRILTQDAIHYSYVANSDFLQEKFQPCSEPNQLCAVMTATPTPSPTPES